MDLSATPSCHCCSCYSIFSPILAALSPLLCCPAHTCEVMHFHLIPLHAWHPMQPLTNTFSINYNWVSGNRERRKSLPHNNINNTPSPTNSYMYVQKTASWNKQGWANKNIINTVIILGYAANYTHGKNLSHIRKSLINYNVHPWQQKGGGGAFCPLECQRCI